MGSKENRLVEIARIGKSHGLEGVVRLVAGREAEPVLEKGALLYLESRTGELEPARIMEIRVEEKRNVRTFFVKFDRIADRSRAESFQDTAVYADPGHPAETPAQGGSVVGFSVRDDSGMVGKVTGLMQNPAHPIIEVELTDSAESGCMLIPWVGEYVVTADEENRVLVCRNLDSLKDL